MFISFITYKCTYEYYNHIFILKLLHLLNILNTHRKRCGFPEKVNNQYQDISDGLYEYVGLPKAAYGGNLCGNCGRNPYIIPQISPLVFGPD